MEFGKEKIMYYIARLTDKIQFLEDFICKRKILSANCIRKVFFSFICKLIDNQILNYILSVTYLQTY